MSDSSRSRVYKKLERYSCDVQKVVQHLMQSECLVTIKDLCDGVSPGDNKMIVCRRALKKLAAEESTIQLVEPQVQTYFHSKHDDPLKSRIEAAVAVMKLNLKDYIYQANKHEFDELCSDLESEIFKTLSNHFMD
jgi:hypothetical protein